jgi:hypothetical protein
MTSLALAALLSSFAYASASASASALAFAVAPLGGDWLQPLADEKGDLGYLSVPLGATEKRPIVVALHGALDQPGMSCAEWRGMFGPYPFIVCPAGTRLNKTQYVWGDPRVLRATIDRAVAAAEARYPGRIEHEGAVWASFSQSGMLSAQALAAPGMKFRYAVLLEGVPKDLRPLPGAFVHAGISRALFANQQAGWSGQHEAAARTVAAVGGGGIETRHVLIGDGSWGHFLRGETFPLMRDALPWLTAGDAVWKAEGR